MTKLEPRVLSPFLLAAVLVGACGDDPAPAAQPADEVEVIPFASTKMLTAADLASLQPDKEDGILVFDHAPAILADVAVGSVLVAGISPATPHGFMRVVTEVARAGDVLTLDTAGAPPQLAFQKLHARVARPVSLDDAEPQMNASIEPLANIGATSERKTPVNVVLFDGDGNTATTDDQLRIEGFFQGAIHFDLSLDVDWGAITELPEAVTKCLASLKKIIKGKPPSCDVKDFLPEVKVKFSVDPSVAADLHMVGQAALAFEKEFDIAAVPLPPLVLGPLVFLPRLEVIAKVEGGASASFKTGVAGHVDMTTSVSVSTKTSGAPQFSPPAIRDKGYTVDTPEVGLHAHAQANAGVRLTMPLYGLVGPYATAEATMALEADPSKTPCWSLRAGLENVIGVRITTPSLGFLGTIELVDWKTAPFKAIDEVVASGVCKDPPPGASRLPPGSGPDAPALRDPTFTPWSHVEEGSVDSTSNASPSVTGPVFSDMSRAIDGRWLVSGSDVRALVKIDDEGKLIWRAGYATGDPETPLSVLRTLPRRDASIVALASGAIGSSFVLLNLGQSGAVRSAQSYALPLDACAAPSPRVMALDAASGFFVLGECQSQGKAFVVHLDRGGNVQDARLWTIEGSGHFGPTAFTRTSTGQLVLTGDVSSADGDGMFVARVDDAASIVAGDAYTACDTAFNLSPTAAIPAESNGLTVVGGSHGQARAFFARLRENGDVGFVTYPGIKEGSAPVFVASAIAELPTTGFVMTASSVELTAEGSNNVPAVALVGLDAQGKAVWGKRYALAGHSSSFPSLRITTDGGALVSSLATTTDLASTATWSMKVFAKDGTLTDPAVTTTPTIIDDGPTDCALKRSAFAPKVEAVEVETTPLTVVRR